MANALRELIPDALQSVEAWMSDHEIAAGARWSNELGNALEGSAFGIICLTPENLQAPWLLFEAGSLAKSVENSRVVPYLYGLGATDVEFPLAQFQGTLATRDGTLKLLHGLNATLNQPLTADRLQRIFERWWPEMEVRLSSIEDPTMAPPPSRDERQLLEEILELVRQSSLRPPPPTPPVPWLPKSIVWRSVHEVTPEEIAALPRSSLTNYLEALKSRWNDTNIRGEEDALESRMERVRSELDARGKPDTNAT